MLNESGFVFERIQRFTWLAGLIYVHGFSFRLLALDFALEISEDPDHHLYAQVSLLVCLQGLSYPLEVDFFGRVAPILDDICEGHSRKVDDHFVNCISVRDCYSQ